MKMVVLGLLATLVVVVISNVKMEPNGPVSLYQASETGKWEHVKEYEQYNDCWNALEILRKEIGHNDTTECM